MRISVSISRRAKTGFSLKELLVVVATLIVIALLAFMIFRSARERALRIQCGKNLALIGGALKSFSQTNGGSLPNCHRPDGEYWGGAWPWDINTNLVTELELQGVTRNAFYCPANPKMNDISHWEFWRFTSSRIRVISYGLLLYGKGQVPPEFWRKDLLGSGSAPPSQTEMAFDATVSMRGDFGRIVGTFTDRSNHMRGSQPRGGNILFEDQHVEWRDFSQMKHRFTTMPDCDWYF